MGEGLAETALADPVDFDVLACPSVAAGCGSSPSSRIPLAVQAVLAHLARSAALAPPAPAATLPGI